MYHIYFPSLKIFSHEQSRPELKRIPFVIQKNGKVIECNVRAQAKGIKSGMTLKDAHTRSITLATETYNEKLYHAVRDKFLQILSAHTPHIELENTVGAFFEPALPLRNMDTTEFTKTLHHQLKRFINTDVRIGYGVNKTIAYVASRISHQDGILVVDGAIAKRFLSLLPLSLLPGLGKRTSLLLQGLNLHTIGQFSQLPLSQIISLFGPSGVELYDRAQGIDPRPLKPNYTPQSIVLSTKVYGEGKTNIRLAFLALCESLMESLKQHGASPESISVIATSLSGQREATKKETSKRMGSFPQVTALAAFEAVLTRLEAIQKISIVAHLPAQTKKSRRARTKRGVETIGASLFSGILGQTPDGASSA